MDALDALICIKITEVQLLSQPFNMPQAPPAQRLGRDGRRCRKPVKLRAHWLWCGKPKFEALHVSILYCKLCLGLN